MIIRTYEDAIASIGMRAADVEFDIPADMRIKPTDYLRKPIGDCRTEGAILDRQEREMMDY